MKNFKILFAILGIFLLTASPAAARKAVIMAYYGTNNDNARTVTIDVLTKMVRDSLPQYTVAEAYTSPAIIHSLESRGIHKPFLDEAIDSLYALGYDKDIRMIHNIVFDFGGVLIEYDFPKYFTKFFGNHDKAMLFINNILTEENNDKLDKDTWVTFQVLNAHYATSSPFLAG